MPIRDDPVQRGRRRGDDLTRRIGHEIRDARMTSGLSQATVARAAGVPRSTVSRIENGRAPNVAIRLAVLLASVVGLDMTASTYPGGRHIRDVAQARLIRRLVVRLGPRWTWRFEVPLPIPGDQRAWDAVMTHRATSRQVWLEAVTRIHDLQALLRHIALKERDGGAARVILLVADTRTNRRLLEDAGDIVRATFPCGTRQGLSSLTRGDLPPGNALILL